MPVTVVVGGQFGSEGKGKVAHFLAKEERAVAAVRVGGINSGHTVIDQHGNALAFQHLPTACILPQVKCVLPAGSYIHVRTLLREMRTASLPADRLIIDPNAMIIAEEDIESEQGADLRASIGSTASGMGAAVQRRIARNFKTTLARDNEELRPFVHKATSYLRDELSSLKRVIVEGTQGFGLSLLHASDYPYATSRDTTAAAAISESGLGPLDVDRVILVIRAFPIRVAGNSGPLPNETSWEEIGNEMGQPNFPGETTTVTKKLRRVARFDSAIVSQAIAANNPTHIVLNHLDYIDREFPSPRSIGFLSDISRRIGRRVDFVGLDRKTVLPVQSNSSVRIANG